MNPKGKDIFNNLSLSFAISSSICAYVFSKYLATSVSWTYLLVLSLTVWGIYTVDHLKDSHRSKAFNVLRYQFHRKYYKQLRITVIVVLALITWLLFLLPLSTVLYGFAVLSVCFLYLWLVHGKKLVVNQKEVFAAFCITMGVVGLLIIQALPLFVWVSLPIFGSFFLTCLINLYLFSFIEKEQDLEIGFATAVTKWDKVKFDERLKALFVAGFLLNVWIMYAGKEFFGLFIVFCLMQMVLFILWQKQEEFIEDEYYRVIGDGVFFIPLIALLF